MLQEQVQTIIRMRNELGVLTQDGFGESALPLYTLFLTAEFCDVCVLPTLK